MRCDSASSSLPLPAHLLGKRCDIVGFGSDVRCGRRLWCLGSLLSLSRGFLCSVGEFLLMPRFGGLLCLRRLDRLLRPVRCGFCVLFLHLFEFARDVVAATARWRGRQPANNRELELTVRARQPVLNAIHEPEFFRWPQRRIEIFGSRIFSSFGRLTVGRRRRKWSRNFSRRLRHLRNVLRQRRNLIPGWRQHVVVILGGNRRKFAVDNHTGRQGTRLVAIDRGVERQRQ